MPDYLSVNPPSNWQVESEGWPDLAHLVTPAAGWLLGHGQTLGLKRRVPAFHLIMIQTRALEVIHRLRSMAAVKLAGRRLLVAEPREPPEEGAEVWPSRAGRPPNLEVLPDADALKSVQANGMLCQAACYSCHQFDASNLAFARLQAS